MTTSRTHAAQAFGWVALSALCLVIAFRDAAARAVQQWVDSPTYSYAFLVVPVSAYLIFTKMAAGRGRSVRPLPGAIALQIPVGLLWYVAVAVEAVEIQQFALLGGIYVAILALLGVCFVRSHLVALALLVFLVPTGQALVAGLQAFSANAAGLLLLLAGVPAYLHDLTIELPHSTYVVAPGCAGLNFLLVSTILGLVLGEVLYVHRIKKVLCFIALTAAAVLSNPIRIFGIIAIDWATDRSTDIVSDHLLYGWLFFAVIIAVLIPIAGHFRDDPPGAASSAPDVLPSIASDGVTAVGLTAIAIAGIVLATLPAVGLTVLATARPMEPRQLARPFAAADGFVLLDSTPWRAIGSQMSFTTARFASIRGGTTDVDVFLRSAATPDLRLIDRGSISGSGGSAARQMTLTPSDGELALGSERAGLNFHFKVICLMANGRCHAATDAYRKAILSGLGDDPRATAALIVANHVQAGAAGTGEQVMRDQVDLIASLVPKVRVLLGGL